VAFVVNPVASFYAVLSTLFTLDEGVLLVRARASASWRKTPGRVLQARWNVVNPSRGGMLVPLVRFEYEVGPTTYVGKRISYHGRVGRRLRELSKQVDRFGLVESVEVWYDPAHPARAVLEPGADKWNYSLTAIGIGVTALAWRVLWLTA